MQARKPIIFFDNNALIRLNPSVREIPISELRLNTRASRSIDSLGIRLIGDLVDMARLGIPSTRDGGPKTAAEIAGCLYALAAAITPAGFVDWLLYADQRKRDAEHVHLRLLGMRPANRRDLRVTSPMLESLNAEVRKYSLKTLHLRPRALNALQARGIVSIGDLVDSARKGIADIRSAGRQTRVELRGTLNALSKSVLLNGDVDFIQYAINRNFQILPAHRLALSNDEFPAVFLGALEAAVSSRFGHSGHLVFTEYYLKNSADSSFQRLRRKLGSTRQAITFRKGNIVRMLRGFLLEDDYTGCRFRFRDALIAPVRRLNSELEASRKSALPRSKWREWAVEASGLGCGNLELLERPLRAILGLDVVHPVARRFEPIVLPKSRGTAAFARAQTKIERLLRSEFPGGLAEVELLEQLRRLGENDIALKEISTLIHSIPGIEYTPSTKRFRLRVEMLTRLADQLERVLDERGSPMHKRELTSAVSGFKKRTGSLRKSVHVVGAMSRDQRFRAIGRSGFWSLAKWEIEIGDIAGVAAHCLLKAGTALTEVELFSLIAARRPVKFNSIMSSLREDGRFQRVGPRTWELKRASP